MLRVISAAGVPQSEDARLLMADFLLAAWFLWMTPLLAALSRARVASLSAAAALHSSLCELEAHKIIGDLRSGRLDLLYVSPERAAS